MSEKMNSQLPRSGPRWGDRARWLKIALVGSVALNLFLAGVIGAWVLRPQFVERSASASPPTAGSIASRMAARLPNADRPILHQAFEAHEREIGEHFKQWRMAQQMTRLALRNDPYDGDAFTAAFERAQEARDKFQMAIHQATREAAGRMSHDGRMKLAQSPGSSRRQ